MLYLEPLLVAFKASENPEKAIWMKNYMRGQFAYYGLETKIRRAILKDFYKSNDYPSDQELFKVVLYLWDQPERECQYTAIELLQKFSKKLEIDDIESIEHLIVTKSWWDTIDGLSAWICGSYFKLFPEQIITITSKWMKSGNFWLQRSCLLFQLKYKENTDTQLLEKFISSLYTEKEFFIRKAIGWVLREYSKTNPDWVRAFVKRQELSGLSYKEATKYL